MLSSLDKDIAQTRLIAATEEMSLTLQRASRSLYVKDAADFACAIADASGRFIAYPQAIGVSGFVGLDVTAAIRTVADAEGLAPGDVILTNDPYLSGGLSTHLPDIHAIAPYFDGDELVGFGWAFVHVSDVGGRVPSSVSVRNDSIFAEGLRIPPVKYVSRGVVSPAVQSLVLANTRTPEANEGDLMAMCAALDTGRERTAALLTQHGATGFAEIGRYARAQTATRATRALSSLADGVYAFEDYLDNDGVSEVPLRIRATVTVRQGHLALDFTGTDPQVEAALNMVTFGQAHSWVVTRMFALIGTLDPDIPLNGGLMDVLSMSAPEGTLLNAVPPAAVGVRHATVSRVNDVLSGALVQAAPQVLPAASSGLVVPVVFAAPTATGTGVNVVEPMVGGTGARFGADGVDGRDSGISNLSNNPVETVEAGVGVRVLAYRLRPDSAGAGRWRGGCGLELEFEALTDGALLARGLERLRFRPWGCYGGRPGAPAELLVNEGRPDEQRLRLIDVHPLRRGDRVVLRTSGAGGYGDPLDRDPDAVLADVRSGLVSEQHALADYGVHVTSGRVDHDATAATRTARRAARTQDCDRPQTFDLGPERAQWSQVFGSATLDRLDAHLHRLPVTDRAATRRDLLTRTLATLPTAFPAGQVPPEELERARERFEADVAGLVTGTGA